LPRGQFGYRWPANRPKIKNVRRPLPFALTQLIEREIDHRSGIKREDLRNDQAADDGDKARNLAKSLTA